MELKPKPVIHGYRAPHQKAPISLIAMTVLTDLLAGAVLYLSGFYFRGLTGILSPAQITYALTISIFILVVQIVFFQKTLGQIIWRTTTLERKHYPLFYFGLSEVPTLRNKIISAAMTAGILGLGFNLFALLHQRDPLYLVLSDKKSLSSLPNISLSDPIEAPFFYLHGHWPQSFRGKPILYKIPYRKGPPTQFVERIVATWLEPDVELFLEGPKTPDDLLEPVQIKECFNSSFRCSKFREAVLKRHILELRPLKVTKWNLEYFEGNAQALASFLAPPRALLLSGENETHAYTRVIFFLENRIVQSMGFKRSLNDVGAEAQAIFNVLVQTLSSHKSLTTARELIDAQLTQTIVRELKPIEDTISFIRQVSNVQFRLLSKISVDPKLVTAFYHLGGTAYLLHKHLNEVRLRKHNLLAADYGALIETWISAEAANIKSTYQYAKDVAPADPVTQRLEQLWYEIKS